ncbi:MAG: ribosome recycling factor [Rickettsiales bacterium]|jgi:ribosome recycling factor|nr:ribosome recycling factor [Rickettsiales bacterium]
MFDINNLKSQLNEKMEKAQEIFKRDLTGLRTGRASVSLLDPIQVSAYGSFMPLNQVASVSVLDNRALSVSVWDRTMVGAVDKAIRESELGLNPAVDGTLMRIPLPALNEERRKELLKVARGYGEDTKTSVRNIRRDGMDALKLAVKNKEISEDDQKHYEDEIQKLTDSHVNEIDAQLDRKEKEIMEV